jgi:hypothetical protein
VYRILYHSTIATPSFCSSFVHLASSTLHDAALLPSPCFFVSLPLFALLLRLSCTRSCCYLLILCASSVRTRIGTKSCALTALPRALAKAYRTRYRVPASAAGEGWRIDGVVGRRGKAFAFGFGIRHSLSSVSYFNDKHATATDQNLIDGQTDGHYIGSCASRRG